MYHHLIHFFVGGGKSRADTYSAIVKNHVRSFVNSGGNASNPEEFAHAITQSSGPANVNVMLGPLQGSLEKAPQTIDQLKQLHDIEFQPGQLLVKKVPGIGTGSTIPINEEMKANVQYRYRIIKQENPETPLPEKRTRQKFFENGLVQTEMSCDYEEENSESEQEMSTNQAGSLFPCSKTEHCSCTFITYQGYLNHIQASDACKITVPSIRDTDKVINWYIKDFGLPDKSNLLKTQEGSDLILQMQKPSTVILCAAFRRANTENSSPDTPLIDFWKRGDGLPKPRTSKRFSQDVHAFVRRLFLEGENSSHKYTAAEAVQLMRVERNPDGSRRFSSHDWLKESQVN